METRSERSLIDRSFPLIQNFLEFLDDTKLENSDLWLKPSKNIYIYTYIYFDPSPRSSSVPF